MRQILARPSTEVAPLLLGARLTNVHPEGVVTVELTEVEAYQGSGDPASHAHRGRTTRNDVMFGEAGHAYVYLSHGIHWCLNVVTGEEGTASGVLLRAGRVVEGQDLAQARRGERVPVRSLARGPGCLARALGVTGENYGDDLCDGSGLSLTLAEHRLAEISQGPRVGVTLAPDEPWRWWVTDDSTVSSYKRSPRAVRL